ncbi:MAG: hypothetical protein ACD_2C00247G0006 [uncultured bacterium (gcode 4)]|uniref:Uncharacterized protein n=1 Tax=uncultured bacterium (gcode 4) TaxID=1234023 RepID=K2G1D7_9BACT|nr:MAG: hypothetical protein ACD_2C00247G0006 [uncultured bacterium (gcode 4)]
MKDGEMIETTDHEEIKNWVESRWWGPAKVKDSSIIRIHYAMKDEPDLEDIGWDEFFEIFDNSRLKFIYQLKTEDWKESRNSRISKK